MVYSSGSRRPLAVHPALQKARIGGSPVVLETKVVIDYQRLGVCVVPHAVTVHVRVDQRQRHQEQE